MSHLIIFIAFLVPLSQITMFAFTVRSQATNELNLF